MQEWLAAQGLPFGTFSPTGGHDSVSVIARGNPIEVPEEVIEADLTRLGFTVEDTHRMTVHNGGSPRPIPLVRIRVSNAPGVRAQLTDDLT